MNVVDTRQDLAEDVCSSLLDEPRNHRLTKAMGLAESNNPGECPDK